MLMFKAELGQSKIHGIGLFLLEPVTKGDIVWSFHTRIDRVFTEADRVSLAPLIADYIDTYACWHEKTGLWMLFGDNARFINHSDNPILLSQGIAFSDYIAAEDLAIGTELNVNYHDTCDKTRMNGVL
jgi:hypothetical protein